MDAMIVRLANALQQKTKAVLYCEAVDRLEPKIGPVTGRGDNDDMVPYQVSFRAEVWSSSMVDKSRRFIVTVTEERNG
jgi:hypothetical protein